MPGVFSRTLLCELADARHVFKFISQALLQLSVADKFEVLHNRPSWRNAPKMRNVELRQRRLLSNLANSKLELQSD